MIGKLLNGALDGAGYWPHGDKREEKTLRSLQQLGLAKYIGGRRKRWEITQAGLPYANPK